MPKHSKPRAGSLQFWPRKRSRKFLPRVNWLAIDSDYKLLGFIGYKVGMASCSVKDNTPDSLTKSKKITIPCTIIELPAMKIFSVRFYKNNIITKEILVYDEKDKELKRRVKLAKKKTGNLDHIKDYDDVRVIVYSLVKNTGIKKTPDLVEVGLGGGVEDKIKFIKENLGKGILFSDIFKEINLVDIRGLTKGKGIQGPVKRFGIGLKSHKSEKGQRGPGNIGPWHPAHTLFRVPMAGQMGMFSRIKYNSKAIAVGKISEKNINPDYGWKHYGKIKTEFLILHGSIQGPAKRQILVTAPLRATKKQSKKQYEFVRLER